VLKKVLVHSPGCVNRRTNKQNGLTDQTKHQKFFCSQSEIGVHMLIKGEEKDYRKRDG